jgi:hypothetical protein
MILITVAPVLTTLNALGAQKVLNGEACRPASLVRHVLPNCSDVVPTGGNVTRQTESGRWRKVGEAPSVKLERSAKCWKMLALPRGVVQKLGGWIFKDLYYMARSLAR